jgi:hypothetical protein
MTGRQRILIIGGQAWLCIQGRGSGLFCGVLYWALAARVAAARSVHGGESALQRRGGRRLISDGEVGDAEDW